jgi:hypothetical protein
MVPVRSALAGCVIACSLVVTGCGASHATAKCADPLQNKYIVPARGFDPFTASDTELWAHGLSSRPTGKVAGESSYPGGPTPLQTWQRFIHAYLAGKVAQC